MVRPQPEPKNQKLKLFNYAVSRSAARGAEIVAGLQIRLFENQKHKKNTVLIYPLPPGLINIILSVAYLFTPINGHPSTVT